jgi:hypothetical protein
MSDRLAVLIVGLSFAGMIWGVYAWARWSK